MQQKKKAATDKAKAKNETSKESKKDDDKKDSCAEKVKKLEAEKEQNKPLTDEEKNKMKGLAQGILDHLSSPQKDKKLDADIAQTKRDLLSAASSVQNAAQIAVDHALF